MASTRYSTRWATSSGLSASAWRRPADAGTLTAIPSSETYGSLAIGVLLLFAAFEVGSSAVEKLVAGTYTAQVTPVSFIVMVGTLVVNLFVTLYERRAGQAAQERDPRG